MRRALTFLVVTAATALSTLWWLHDGDLRGAIEPVLADFGGDPSPDGIPQDASRP